MLQALEIKFPHSNPENVWVYFEAYSSDSDLDMLKWGPSVRDLAC